MADIDLKTIAKYAAYAAAAYIVWVYVLEPMINGPGVAASTGGGLPAGQKTAEQIAADALAANAKTAADALAAAEAKKAADAKALVDLAAKQTIAANEASTIAQALQKAAGSQQMIGVDGWNYYLRQLNPNAVVSDLAEVGVDRNIPMSVNQYLSYRVQAGLMDTYTPFNVRGGVTGIPSRMLN